MHAIWVYRACTCLVAFEALNESVFDKFGSILWIWPNVGCVYAERILSNLRNWISLMASWWSVTTLCVVVWSWRLVLQSMGETISVFVEINCDVLVIWNELLMPLWDREDLLWMKWFHGTWNGGEAHGLKGGNGNQLKKTTMLWCR